MEQIRNILVPVDQSPICVPTLKIAKVLAEKKDANLFLQCVTDSKIVGSQGLESSSLRQDLMKLSQKNLNEMIRESGVGGVKHGSEVKSGVPFMEIISRAADQGSDLIILGSLSWQSSEKHSLGNTAYKVVRVASSHTLITRRKKGSNGEQEIPMKKVLVCMDVSEQAFKALNYALDLKRIFDSEVHVLNVYSEMEDPETKKVEAQDSLKKNLSSDNYSAIDSVKVLTGSKPATEIINWAEELDIDLVVIGSHRKRRFLSNLFLGKVAYDVVRKVGCSVLAIKYPGVF